MIDQFKGIYRFLSNFYYLSNGIVYDNIYYPTVEHFFQAMKTLIRWERVQISLARSPGIAKRMASRKGYMTPTGLFKIVLRPDWEDIKIRVMAYALAEKFRNNPLRQKLIDTHPQELVEGNYWNDKVWGFCLKTNEGQNLLGLLLMEVRMRLINDEPLIVSDHGF